MTQVDMDFYMGNNFRTGLLWDIHGALRVKLRWTSAAWVCINVLFLEVTTAAISRRNVVQQALQTCINRNKKDFGLTHMMVTFIIIHIQNSMNYYIFIVCLLKFAAMCLNYNFIILICNTNIIISFGKFISKKILIISGFSRYQTSNSFVYKPEHYYSIKSLILIPSKH